MRDRFSEGTAAILDSKRVYRAYEDWPSLARMGIAARPELPDAEIDRVYFLGMGGSAAGGDIVAGWLSRGHNAEARVFKGEVGVADLHGSVAIACSVSGQTEETVMMLKTAVERGAFAVSVSSGGVLAEVSSRLGVPHVTAPSALAPRYLLPFMTFACISIAADALRLDVRLEVEDALSEMEAESKEIAMGTPTESNPSKTIALELLEKTPAVYGTAVTKGAGVRFKSILNENAKKHAYFDLIPEVFHNEVEAWEDKSASFVPVFLRHSLDAEREKALTDRMQRMLSGLGRPPLEVRGRGRTALAQLVTMVYRLDLAAYYVALGLGRDPFPTRLIEELKK